LKTKVLYNVPWQNQRFCQGELQGLFFFGCENRQDLAMSQKLKAERRTMETRIYPTRDLDVQKIAQALVSEYQGKGFEAQQFGDSNQASVQLRKESTLRTITGFDKSLGISFQHSSDETIVQVGASDLVTAAIGAVQQRNVVHEVLDSIDQLVHQQQPQVMASAPPTNPAG
jgi:hypothetical protein